MAARILTAAGAWFMAGALVLAGEGAPAAAGDAQAIKPNTWIKVTIEKVKPDESTGVNWNHGGEGFSTSLYRSKTGTVLIRTGVGSKQIWTGFYGNATAEWDLKTDKATLVEHSTWYGGSGGNGALPPDFKERPTPCPRHTYDGVCYVEDEDAYYLTPGASWRLGLGTATPEAKAALAVDDDSTWRYSFADKAWTRIDGGPRKAIGGMFENHMRHWPAGNKLIFFSRIPGNVVGEFDLKTRKWEKLTTKNKNPMDLTEARSTWDSKRGLWVFRHGPEACAYDPATREFTALPNIHPMPEDVKDPRRHAQSIAYNSRHDVYFVAGTTGNDTWVYSPEKKVWTNLACGPEPLIGKGWHYLQYDPKTDLTVMSNCGFEAFKFRYVPSAK